MGLGLYLSNASIEQFGGNIHLWHRPTAPACAAYAYPFYKDSHAKRVLVIDDDIAFHAKLLNRSLVRQETASPLCAQRRANLGASATLSA